MSKIFLKDLSTINSQLISEDLFKSFKEQLAKDFEQSDFENHFITTLLPRYNIIHKKIILELERADRKQLMQLLNRIDISESQLKKYLLLQADESRLSVISELIIKRVLQKVVIRKFYKSK